MDPEEADHAKGGGRRERLRRETSIALRQAAFEELRERGASGLSLRSVARRIEMSPAGLYRYVASRDELLTLLITDAYEDLGRHVRSALDGVAEGADVADRLRAVAHAYRSWSVANPHEFALLFGDPIPGYTAPPGGPTVVAMTSFATALAEPVLDAWHDGRIRDLSRLPNDVVGRLAPLSQLSELTGDAPPEVAALLLLAWGRMHGQISLEVFGHHTWAFPDGCAELYAADVELMLLDLGVTATNDPAGRA